MQCSLNCFCAFSEANSGAQRASVIKRYKLGATGPIRGMVGYYRPVLQLIRGRLGGNLNFEEKIQTLRQACIIASWSDKFNDARIEANILAYKAFHSEFGNKTLKVLPNPRLQYLVSTDVAVNLQPEFFAEVDGVTMMWKLGMTKTPRSEKTIRLILQMFTNATMHKGIEIPIQQIRFLDTRSGKIYVEEVYDSELRKSLAPAAQALFDEWQKIA